jgi:hypothetical protein
MRSKRKMWMGLGSAALIGRLIQRVINENAGLPTKHTLTIMLLCALPLHAANTYYISSSTGSDSFSSAQAQSKTTPWAHLPGMASCTSNCGSYTPTAGDTFILMGCDVWVNADLPVLWNWSGSSGSIITIGGEDKTWYNTANCPSAWNRPVFDGQKSALSTEVFFRAASGGNTAYGKLDNIEMRGLYCTGACGGTQNYVGCYNNCTNWTFSNLYLHGWNIVLDGNCILFQAAPTDTGTIFTQNIIDGSDATGASPAGATCSAMYPTLVPTVSNNVIHDLANGIVGHADSGGVSTVSGNLIYNVAESNNGAHPNAIEFVGAATYYVYNNVVHDNVGESLSTGNSGEIDYIWNNVIYNILGNPPDIDVRSGSLTGSWWNNSIVSQSGGTCFIQTGAGSASETIENTHCITTSGLGVSGGNYTLNNNTIMDYTTATSQGYTSSETYAYSPTAGTNSTVGAGKQICGVEESCTGNFAALADDTTYGCSYNSSAETISCPARTVNARKTTPDSGAYEYGDPPPPPNPPTDLTAVVQ